MKQTKQFLRPLLMAIVMMVGMLVPQGAWAQDLYVDRETRTISSNESYDDIEVLNGGFLIINEGVTLTVTTSLYINDDNINGFGTVINYGTIIGEGQINMDGGVLANHGHIDLHGASGHGTFTFYNTGTLGEYINLTTTEECDHDEYDNLGTVEATCTHGAGTQYRCKTCYYMRLDETSGALPHNINSHNGMNICSSCGHTTYEEPANGDGSEEDPYQIANAGNLYWFADYTRNENSSANAILTADIVLNDGTFATDGTFTATGADEPSKPFPWICIGGADDSYDGTFDGNGHTISGMYVNGSFGLFYTLYGSVVNLGIVNCYIRVYDHTGAICNWNYGTISNCYTTGILSGSYGSGICDMNVGGSTISNCYSTCSFVNDIFFGGSGICGTNMGTISNCYTSYDTAIQDNAETVSEVYGGVSADRFASGEIAYKLNGSVDGEGNWTAGATNGTQAWYQKLGENGDSYPVLAAAEGKTVYYGYENCQSESETYSNNRCYAEKEDAHDWNASNDCVHECNICEREADHDWSNGKCTVCEYECTHTIGIYDQWENGVCTICGMECKHDWISDEDGHACNICDLGDAEHDWSNKDGKCTACGYECNSHDWFDGECEICGILCHHELRAVDDGEDVYHLCSICDFVEEHDFSNEDGKCTACGYVCDHEDWENGVCELCGYECKHKDSDEDDYCDICGIHAQNIASLAALIAAGQDYDAVNVTIDEVILMAMPHPYPDFSGMYLVALKSGVQLVAPIPEPALNWLSGGTIKGTLKYADWDETDKMLSSKDASFWSNLTYTPAVAKEYNSIDKLLADENLENGTLVTVTVEGTIAETQYAGEMKQYQIVLDNGFVLGALEVAADPGWEVGGTISGTLENVTFMKNDEAGEEAVGIVSLNRNIFAELNYAAPAVTIGGQEIEIALNSEGKYETSTPIVLSDDAIFAANVDFIAPSASYTRTGIKNQWGTIVVPFDVTGSNDYDFYTLTSATNEELTLTKVNGTLNAGTPALIRINTELVTDQTYNLELNSAEGTVTVNADVENGSSANGLTLTGSYSVKDITDEDGYIISNNKFWSIQEVKGGNNVYCAPFRAYIASSAPASAKALNISISEEADAIEAITAITEGDAEYYDMNGRRLNSLQTGVNIVKYSNGKTKKVIVK